LPAGWEPKSTVKSDCATEKKKSEEESKDKSREKFALLKAKGALPSKSQKVIAGHRLEACAIERVDAFELVP
jgi:hypothetical protein